jgi:hypothetical protein
MKRGAVTTAAIVMAFVFGALPLRALAQDGWLRGGIALEGRPNLAASGDFAVVQIATAKPDKLMADWLKPTPGVYVTNDWHTTRNKPIVVFIVFKGCRADASGNCNVTVDYETLAPDGKTYDSKKAAEVWVGYPPPPNLNPQLSVSGYGLIFEPKDALGDYGVHATITDHVAGITLNTEQVLTVTAAQVKPLKFEA